MTNLKYFTATVAAAAAIALGTCAFAQDDLDDLLKDLESESFATAEEPAPEEKAPVAEAEEAPAEAPAEVAEEPAEAEEAPAEEEPAEEPEVTAEEEAPAEAEEAPAEEEAAAEEEVAEEAAAEEEPAEVTEEATAEPTEVAETPAEAADEAAEAEEASAEEEAAAAEEEPAEVTEEATAEPTEVAEAPAEAEPEAEPTMIEKVDSALSLLDDLAAETSGEVEQVPAPVAEKAPAAPANPDAELIASIKATEKLRREAYDKEAMREIAEARTAMKGREYQEAAHHYGIAIKLLNDRPASKKLRKECEQGIAEGLYRAAMEEDETGRRERAIKLMEKAVEMRHPKARKQLEKWLTGDDPKANKTNYGDVKHRKNDDDFKAKREANRKHLKRARQLLSVREIDKALEECEIVLVNDPYNQEAMRLRAAIISKKGLILGQEFKVARDGMIAEVDKAWRPVYAPNARKLEEMSSTTVKNALGDDPERAQEQMIIQRMKEMRLPQINFKPPSTIIDAIDVFRQMSRDFDRPELPLEQRGFNFVVNTGETISIQQAPEDEEDSDDFSSTDNDVAEGGGLQGVPMLQMISATDITLYEALKLVCDQVGYKFKVQGPIVMVMPKGVSTDEMMIRSYPVLSTFMEKMDTASSEMKEMKSAGFGSSSSRRGDDGNESQERDWKAFFEELGVEWPQGSSIMYIKTIGKLRVKNTYENLAELEKALTEMNADPRLVEIEARFVEVEQEDLNSLGFEWILNSDYSLNVGKLGKWAGVNNGKFPQVVSTSTDVSAAEAAAIGAWSSTQNVTKEVLGTATTTSPTSGGTWTRDTSNLSTSRNVGINAFGGSSDYQNGNRYLSTEGNHVSGPGNSNNDQFMRVNAFLGSADLSMILHMLAQRSDTDLLSAPKVLTKPGEEAVIKVVTEFIYPTDYDVQLQSSNSSSSGSSGSGQAAVLAVVEPQSFTMREVGVILTCTPTLTDDGNLIDLKLNAQVVDEPTWKNYGMRIPFSGNAQNWPPEWPQAPEFGDNAEVKIPKEVVDAVYAAYTKTILNLVDSLGNNNNITYYEAPMEQPFFHVRQIDSSVSVFPGATIVMGGLITEARKAMDDKIPFLGDLPFIGRLFRSHAEKTTKRNLLIFVTTRLVDVHGREISFSGTDDVTGSEVKPAPEAGLY